MCVPMLIRVPRQFGFPIAQLTRKTFLSGRAILGRVGWVENGQNGSELSGHGVCSLLLANLKWGFCELLNQGFQVAVSLLYWGSGLFCICLATFVSGAVWGSMLLFRLDEQAT